MTTTFFYDWPLWCAGSFSGCEWAYCHGTLLCELSIPKCGGVLGGNAQNRAEKRNVVLTWFRPVTWSSGHLGRRCSFGFGSGFGVYFGAPLRFGGALYFVRGTCDRKSLFVYTCYWHCSDSWTSAFLFADFLWQTAFLELAKPIPHLPRFPAFLLLWNLLRPLFFWGERDLPHFPHFRRISKKIRPTGFIMTGLQVTQIR